MTSSVSFRLLAAFVALATATALSAQSTPATLKIGDPAPPLAPSQWLRGEPVTTFQPGTTYLVEFWATWCGPCLAAIPHLQALHLKYSDRGLVVIGQNVWERKPGLVPPFLTQMKQRMTYRIALDDPPAGSEGVMATTWMKAAGRNGIPTAFLVDGHGRIAWIGHTMELSDVVLESVLSGNYDLGAAAEEYGRAMLTQAKRDELGKQLTVAVKEKNWDAAEATLAELKAIAPRGELPQIDGFLVQLKLNRGDGAAALVLARQAASAYPSDSTLQNELAWQLATHPAFKERELALALACATRAADLTNHEHAGILDTLARVYFLLGRKDEAIATQEKAVGLANDREKPELQKTLDEYRSR